MSRRLNRDPVPLHKTEACSNILQWPDLAHGGYSATLNGVAGFLDGLSKGMCLRWSLTYVATPIAVAVREALFTSSGLTNSARKGVKQSLLCTAWSFLVRLGSTLPS